MQEKKKGSDQSQDSSCDERKKKSEKALKPEKEKEKITQHDRSGKELNKSSDAMIPKMIKEEQNIIEKTDEDKEEDKCRERDDGRSEKNYIQHVEVSRKEDDSDRNVEKCKSEFNEKSLDNERCIEYAKNEKPKENLTKKKHYDNSKNLNSNSKSRIKREYAEESYSQGSKKIKKMQNKMPAIPWVRENLRVRLISKHYKGGRYFKEKVSYLCP